MRIILKYEPMPVRFTVRKDFLRRETETDTETGTKTETVTDGVREEENK